MSTPLCSTPQALPSLVGDLPSSEDGNGVEDGVLIAIDASKNYLAR